MTALRAALLATALMSCSFDRAVPVDTQVSCVEPDECPSPLICFVGKCVSPDTPCITVIGGAFAPEPDGTICATAAGPGICLESSCVPPVCGDGVVSEGEQCELGTSRCRTDCTRRRCGDAIIDTDVELCDNGDANSDTTADACRTRCQLPGCGDGVVDTGEQCDNGDDNSDTAATACRSTCVSFSCGDSVTDAGEACDDGDDNSDSTPNACRLSCVEPTCGDTVTDDGEVCDDGNTTSGDGCSGDCTAVD